MPTYDFQCKDCKHQFEALANLNQTDIKCLQCGSTQTNKLLSAPAIILKGEGFYKTDSNKKSTSSACQSSNCSSCSSCG